MCSRRPAVPPYLRLGTVENERYVSCMNLVRTDYPCICGRCEVERKEGYGQYVENLTTLNRRMI